MHLQPGRGLRQRQRKIRQGLGEHGGVGVVPAEPGVDVALFGRHVDRLVQLGYALAGARQHLAWPLGRMLLHRGDPDLTSKRPVQLTVGFALEATGKPTVFIDQR